MNITYKNPGYDHSIDSISLFLTGDETPFWSEPIFHFYPQVDKHALSNCNHTEKHKYLNDVFRDIYENLREEIDKRSFVIMSTSKTIKVKSKMHCQMRLVWTPVPYLMI